MKKAVFFDIDGTLIDIRNKHTKLTARVKEAIQDLRREGHYAFIASGRPYAYLDPELLKTGLFNGFVLMNGSFVLADGEVLNDQPLPKEVVREAVELCYRREAEFVLEGRYDVYLRPDFEMMKDFYRSIDVSLERFLYSFDLDSTDIYKMEFLSKPEHADEVYEYLMNLPGLTGLRDPAHLSNMEMYAADVTKGTGIEHALKKLGIPLSESYAFGDGLNDLEMMDTVGTALVMGNGQDALKEKATHIVPTVAEDGVAYGIWHHILGGSYHKKI